MNQPNPAEAPPLNNREHAQKCLETTNEGAIHVRNLYLTLLVTGVYIGIIIAGTTDEQLLRDSPTTLPLLNVKVPIKSFYEFVPWAFVLLHFNMLLQFTLLAEKARAFGKCLKSLSGEEQFMLKEQLFSFPFLCMLLNNYQDRLLRSFMALMISVTVIVLPLGLLLWAQMAFLPYREASVTWGHRAAIIVDIYFLTVFWPRIVSSEGFSEGTFKWWFKWCKQRLFWLGGRIVPFFKVVWDLVRIRENVGERKARRIPGVPAELDDRGRGTSFLLITAVFIITVSIAMMTLPDKPEEGKNIFPDSKLDFMENPLTANELSAKTINTLREGEAQERDEALKEALGINLDNRTLRYAELSRAILPKANLTGSDLRGAKLQEAQLQGANLRNAQLQGAKLHGAKLHGANLFGAQLQGAILQTAELQGADLESASLSGSDLYRANLQGARLTSAQLQGADFQEAQLQGADLSEADLRGANFDGANLRGADLQAAAIGGADFHGAILDQADLRDVDPTPFTQTQYDFLVAEIVEGIQEPGTREQVPRIFEENIDAAVNLERAVIRDDSCISNVSESDSKCTIVLEPIHPRVEDFYRGHRLQLASFLAEIACHDPDVGRQVARRVTRGQEKEFVSHFISRATNTCKIIEKLPEEIGKKLEDLVNYSSPGS